MLPVKSISVVYRNCFLLLLLLAFASPAAYAQIPDSLFPKQQDPPRLVNDHTGTLSETERQWLEDKLVDFDRSTSTQVSIEIVKTIAGYNIADYATELGRRRGIGQKEKNNGVLIVMATQLRDVNISVGYGLEAVLPDVLCKRIIENEMVPSFKKGYYYEGLDKATTVIIAAAKGQFEAGKVYGKKRWQMPRWAIILLLIVGINVFLVFGVGLLIKLFYYLIGRKPPTKRHREWTYSTTDVKEKKYESGSSNNSGSSNDFGGYGGGSFGGAGASGKW